MKAADSELDALRAAGLTPPGLGEFDADLQNTWQARPGLIGWLMTGDHKRIGKLQIVTAFIFFLLGGIEAALMRLQLWRPENNFLSASQYNQIFTTHGTTMMFLFAVPVMQGFGTYLTPLMVGTRALVFPRLAAFAYWTYLGGGLMLYGLSEGGAAAAAALMHTSQTLFLLIFGGFCFFLTFFYKKSPALAQHS